MCETGAFGLFDDDVGHNMHSIEKQQQSPGSVSFQVRRDSSSTLHFFGPEEVVTIFRFFSKKENTTHTAATIKKGKGRSPKREKDEQRERGASRPANETQQTAKKACTTPPGSIPKKEVPDGQAACCIAPLCVCVCVCGGLLPS